MRRASTDALAALSLLILLGGCGQADIRPRHLRQAAYSDEAIRRGRDLLAAAAERHGLAAWSSYATMEALARDEWPSWRRFFGHWPGSRQRFRSQALLGTYTSRVELLDGKRQGEIWGIQSWVAYKLVPGAEPAFQRDEAIEFYLPTLQYFNELPFRLVAAENVAHLGRRSLDGRSYELVYATWGGFVPNGEHDQFIVWVNSESGLVDKVQYTVRDASRTATGTMHFADYRRVQGVLVPFLQTATRRAPDDVRAPLEHHFFHRVTLQAAIFDSFSPQLLLPDPELPASGDHKLIGPRPS